MSEITFIEAPYLLQEGSGAPSRSLEWADSPWAPAPQSPAAERQVLQVGLESEEASALAGLGDLMTGNTVIVLALLAGGAWLLYQARKDDGGMQGLAGLAGAPRFKAKRKGVVMHSPVGDLSVFLRTDR